MPTRPCGRPEVLAGRWISAALLGLACLAGAALNAQAGSAASIYLLGEVHDNPQAHAQRLLLIERLVAADFRPVLAMEQFDRDQQAALDRALASCEDADCVIVQAGGKGWNWAFYKPVIAIALQHKLPIVAANVSSADSFKVARQGFAAALAAQTVRDYRLDQPLDSGVFDKQKQAMEAGHCHMLPAHLIKGMVEAQVARDVWMAKTIREHAARGVILLAGNGHVRKDIGVYHWLSSAERARTQVQAFTEDDEAADSTLYDRQVRVAPFERPDPCEAFQPKARLRT